MPKKSSLSVKITYFNKPAVEEALRKYLSELDQKYPEIEKVILFGSFLQERSIPGSDLDLLLVLRESSLPFLERIPHYMPSSFPVGVDVFPYTQEEITRMIREGNQFLKQALEKGKLLFSRSQHS